MAIMYPASISEGTPFSEKCVFEWFKDAEIEGSCYHSVLIPTNGEDSECDFVYVGRQGILCVEVKGGKISREDGIFYTENAQIVKTEIKNPYKQVKDDCHTLLRNLKNEYPYEHIGNLYFGSIVIFPNMKEIDGVIGCDKEITYCGYSYNPTDFKLFLDHAFEQGKIRSKEHLLENYHVDATFVDLSDHQSILINNYLKSDFGQIRTFTQKLARTDENIKQFTLSQKMALKIHEQNPRVLVFGEAGTGKTQIAFEQVKSLAEKKDKKVLYVCFNRFMAQYAHEWLGGDNIPENVKVWEYMDALSDIILQDNNIRRSLEKLLSDENRQQDLKKVLMQKIPLDVFNGYCLEYFRTHLIEPFDYLILDEAQDILCKSTYEVLNKIIKSPENKEPMKHGNWVILMDKNQNIFKNNDETVDILNEKFRPVQVFLDVNCRNTKQIAEKTFEKSGAGCQNAPVHGESDVFEYSYENSADLLENLGKTILALIKTGVHSKDIIVLSDTRFEKFHFPKDRVCEEGKNSADEMVYSVDFDEAKMVADTELSPVFPSDKVRFYTLHRFKGLDSQIVIYIKNRKPSKDDIDTNDYVGMSRARAALVVFENAHPRW